MDHLSCSFEGAQIDRMAKEIHIDVERPQFGERTCHANVFEKKEYCTEVDFVRLEG